MHDITALPAWQALNHHHHELASQHLVELFNSDPERARKFSLQAAGLLLDFSKNRINERTVSLLCQYAAAVQLPHYIDGLFEGAWVNTSEQQPAHHTALRDRNHSLSNRNDQHCTAMIAPSLKKMAYFSDALHTGILTGFSQQAFTDVVNIGIGGSDIGPRLVVAALKPYQQRIRCHFVANIDENELYDILTTLNPHTTLFIISSKSFTTLETLTNAHSARNWLLQHGATAADVMNHFVAITANPSKALAFGVKSEAIFTIPQSVGGRFSLWSAVGLPIVISIGMTRFYELLHGAFLMDQHFRYTELSRNIPVIMALLTFWYVNFFQVQTIAVLGYDQRLALLRPHLQQLEMESNGKHITREGHTVNYATGPIVWGESGTNGQHAFHQLLHQGTSLVPVDFIVPLKGHYDAPAHRQILVASALSQAAALMRGQSVAQSQHYLIAQGYTANEAIRLAPHLACTGNRPSNMLLFDQLTPERLGALLALYEHKIFTQSILWNINAFDQWGVEYGKQLTQQLLPHLINPSSCPTMDSSTQLLLNYYHQMCHATKATEQGK